MTQSPRPQADTPLFKKEGSLKKANEEALDA